MKISCTLKAICIEELDSTPEAEKLELFNKNSLPYVNIKDLPNNSIIIMTSNETRIDFTKLNNSFLKVEHDKILGEVDYQYILSAFLNSSKVLIFIGKIFDFSYHK